MQSISVTRYSDPKATGWAGYIEPRDRSWIAFIGLDGAPRFFLNRDPQTGAILGDDPTTHARDIAEIAAVGGLRTGMPSDGSAVFPEGEIDPLKRGEVVFPLGVRSDPA